MTGTVIALLIFGAAVILFRRPLAIIFALTVYIFFVALILVALGVIK